MGRRLKGSAGRGEFFTALRLLACQFGLPKAVQMVREALDINDKAVEWWLGPNSGASTSGMPSASAALDDWFHAVLDSYGQYSGKTPTQAELPEPNETIFEDELDARTHDLFVEALLVEFGLTGRTPSEWLDRGLLFSSPWLEVVAPRDSRRAVWALASELRRVVEPQADPDWVAAHGARWADEALKSLIAFMAEARRDGDFPIGQALKCVRLEDVPVDPQFAEIVVASALRHLEPHWAIKARVLPKGPAYWLAREGAKAMAIVIRDGKITAARIHWTFYLADYHGEVGPWQTWLIDDTAGEESRKDAAFRRYLGLFNTPHEAMPTAEDPQSQTDVGLSALADNSAPVQRSLGMHLGDEGGMTSQGSLQQRLRALFSPTPRMTWPLR